MRDRCGGGCVQLRTDTSRLEGVQTERQSRADHPAQHVSCAGGRQASIAVGHQANRPTGVGDDGGRTLQEDHGVHGACTVSGRFDPIRADTVTEESLELSVVGCQDRRPLPRCELADGAGVDRGGKVGVQNGAGDGRVAQPGADHQGPMPTRPTRLPDRYDDGFDRRGGCGFGARYRDRHVAGTGPESCGGGERDRSRHRRLSRRRATRPPPTCGCRRGVGASGRGRSTPSDGSRLANSRVRCRPRRVHRTAGGRRSCSAPVWQHRR